MLINIGSAATLAALKKLAELEGEALEKHAAATAAVFAPGHVPSSAVEKFALWVAAMGRHEAEKPVCPVDPGEWATTLSEQLAAVAASGVGPETACVMQAVQTYFDATRGVVSHDLAKALTPFAALVKTGRGSGSSGGLWRKIAEIGGDPERVVALVSRVVNGGTADLGLPVAEDGGASF